MGRQSPGKWIRNLLLGKKSSSKSKSSTEKDIYKPSSTKDVLVVSSETSMSSSISGANAIKGKLSEKEVVSVSSNDGTILSTEDELSNGQSHDNFYSEDRNEKSRIIKTAITTIQAAIRGYQARGTYKTVKGIIPLQAYIRGQLVRRQAISALCCVKSIVRFQALARGYKVRHSDIGLAVQKLLKDTKFSKSTGVVTSTQAVKLSDNNTFAHKLLASSPYAVSPRLKYNTGEPNLVWEWLDRWTKSHFWVPLQETDKKNGSSQTVETNKGQVKKNARKGPSHDLVSDSNKHKRYPKKDSNPALHSSKEHPPKELEKRSSKKSQIQNFSDKSQASVARKVSDHTKVNAVPEEDAGASSEKMKYLAVSKSEECDLVKSLIQQAQEHDNNEPCNGTDSPLQPSLMNSKDGGVIEEMNDVKSKNFQRRASLPANFTDLENVLHDNTPRLPSYMAPTESTKAKLRGQCSPRSVSDLADVSSITRRLSLSSSLSVKLGSFSPRSDRLAALTNKIRTDRSLSSSRDGTLNSA
ncbi:protein IQ-DOMAIN 31 isoform X2 [Vigna radiata var. radiata]|uniref:Protein IQ-DOMAIN 31 isoform X2 n=1 Tax=Vigna radiata var. radiata TaxID=3916 RepID=A0A3Q0F4A1_VIGRR|nr:protein IQ-DOMAIN 31 isoform X2 [Vigna radiata var. radiata]